MIIIKKSPTADTGSCNFKEVSAAELKRATVDHSWDVERAMRMFSDMMIKAGADHDDHKLRTMEEFHKAFIGGFRDDTWWNEHKKERHHLPDGLKLNLVDILEHIADCVMAGMTRTGRVSPLTINNEMLQRAFNNTVNLLISQVKVEENDEH